MKSNLRLFFILLLVTAGTGVLWYLEGHAGDISLETQAEFAIADTSEVTKIFIADKHQSVLLEREKGDAYFTLNGEGNARKSSSDLLLKTFDRAAVKGAVPELMRSTVMTNLSVSAKKVEIYTDDDEPVKTWYVGTATPSHTGTYMLLETPSMGKASEPFIVHMEGFTGFLTTRFFTDSEEWKYTGIFSYLDRSLQEVSVVNHVDDYSSYEIKSDSTGTLNLYNKNGLEIGYIDTIRVQDQFNRYRKAHFESFNSRLTEQEEVSLKQTTPHYTITCADTNGVKTSVFLYDKDEEYFYGVTQDGQVVLAQTFVFNPLTIGLHELLQIK